MTINPFKERLALTVPDKPEVEVLGSLTDAVLAKEGLGPQHREVADLNRLVVRIQAPDIDIHKKDPPNLQKNSHSIWTINFRPRSQVGILRKTGVL